MNTFRNALIGTAACLPFAIPTVDAAQRARPREAARAEAPVPVAVRTLKLSDSIYVLLGAGGNIVAQVGDAGVMLVNTGNAGTSEAVLAALQRIMDRPLRMILNTNAESHNVGGNEALYHAGRFVGDRGQVNHAQISAHEAVLNRLSAPQGQTPALPEVAWPTDVFYTHTLEFHFNGEGIVMYHAPAARTDGDAFVYFRKSDVIAAGDLFLQHSYPVINVDQGGSIQGVIDALNRMIDIAITEVNQEGGTMIVSGDGRPGDEYEVVIYRDMVTVFRDRIADLKKKGQSLEQVLAARPTRDFDGRYATSAWTAEQFVTAIYRTVETEAATARAGE